MYRVMIVDDEPIIRKGLISFVEWNALECEIVHEAEDGIDAMEKVKALVPDIAFIDIKMPSMNGLELATYLDEHFPHIKIIILTGYADFSYAQAAIGCGVVDFILKPTSTPKIITAVNKAKELLSREEVEEKRILYLQNEVQKNRSAIKEKLLFEIISRVITDKVAINNSLNNYLISNGPFYLLTLEIDKAEDGCSENAPIGQEDLNSILRNAVKTILADMEHYTVSMNSRMLSIYFPLKSGEPVKNLEIVNRVAANILYMAESIIKFEITLGMSNLHHDAAEIPEAYEESLEALSNKFYEEGGRRIYRLAADSTGVLDPMELKEHLGSILDSMQAMDPNEAIRELKKLIERLRVRKIPADVIRSTGLFVCSLCTRFMLDQNFTPTEVLGWQENPYKKVLQCKTMDELFEVLAQTIESILKNMKLSLNTKNYMVRMVKEYLRYHFSEDIRLNDLAEMVHTNECYLSRLYRKDTGETITEAVTRLRMEKAKELLQKTNMKTYEVSFAIGIDNSAYFSQLFKRYTGVNPKEYKDMGVCRRSNAFSQ